MCIKVITYSYRRKIKIKSYLHKPRHSWKELRGLALPDSKTSYKVTAPTTPQLCGRINTGIIAQRECRNGPARIQSPDF